MAEITRDFILGGPDRPVKQIEIKDFGTAFVRCMSGHELDKFSKRPSGEGILSLCFSAALTLCDASGARLFKFEEAEIIGQSLSIDVLNEIAKQFSKLNALDAESAEELRKNS